MKLKYHDDLSRFPDCPPIDSFGRTCTVYCLVFQAEAETKLNFLPVALNPNSKNMLARTRCSGYSLSFWDKMQDLLDRFISQNYRKAEKEGKTIQKKYHVPPAIGTHIAELNIQESDGRMSQPNDKGHIDFHPFEGIDLHERITQYIHIPKS